MPIRKVRIGKRLQKALERNGYYSIFLVVLHWSSAAVSSTPRICVPWST